MSLFRVASSRGSRASSWSIPHGSVSSDIILDPLSCDVRPVSGIRVPDIELMWGPLGEF